MTAEATLNTIINNALTTASSKALEAKGYTDSAINSLDSATWFPASAPVFSGGPVDPVRPSNIETDPVSTINSELSAEAARLTGLLSSTFSGMLNAYFPRASASLVAAENWLETTIVNGATGIPASVENQIWDRSRARELLDGARRKDAAVSDLAARGFTLPQGSLVGMNQEIDQDISDKIITHSRDVAIKQVEIQIETIKFAVAQALDYRMKSIAAAIEYWRAYLLPEDIAAKKASVTADLKFKFYNTAVEMYRSDIQLYGLHVQNNRDFMEVGLRGYETDSNTKSSYAKAKADAAMAAAKAAAEQASSALSSLNTMSQLANTTITNA